MNGYVGIFNGKRVEVYADSLLNAKKEVIAKLKVPMSKWGLVSVMLAEKGGKPVTHIAVD